MHGKECSQKTTRLELTDEIRLYLAPERTISFDGFVAYEGRRFGVPYGYEQKTCRVMRDGYTLYIYDQKMQYELNKELNKALIVKTEWLKLKVLKHE